MPTLVMPEVSEIRKTLELVLKDEEVSLERSNATRQALESLFSEASEHGLTAADVIRSVLSPVLEPARPGCDCPTCRFRRSELDQADPGPSRDW